MNTYDDIIHLNPPTNPARRHMSIEARAAQFVPFAALNGFNDAVAEVARPTESDISLVDDSFYQLNRVLEHALRHKTNPVLRITYFKADKNKDGGRMIKLTRRIQRIDSDFGEIVLANGSTIPLNAVRKIEIPHSND